MGNGLLIEYEGVKYAIDKVPRDVKADYYLVSHAHTDHLPSIENLEVVASEETILLASCRGRFYSKCTKNVKDVELINAGHILGSTSFIIGGKILYTGDVNIYDRFFLRGFNAQQADVLIMEATYGDRRFVFGSFHNNLRRLREKVANLLSENKNVILKAFALGKPQLLMAAFDWYDKLYVTRSVYKYNKAYWRLKVLNNPGELIKHNPDEPFILISSDREFAETHLRTKHDVRVIHLSGWSLLRPDAGLPLSDHVDFNDLIRIVDKVSPKKVYVAYGFKHEFTHYLRYLGYDASPLA